MENGWTKIPNKLLLSDKLNKNEKLVLMVLLLHSGNKKDCFPSRPLIAKETGLFVRTVDIAVKSLEEKRFIKVDRSLKVNSYKINF